MKIFVTRKIPGDELKKLNSDHEVTISEFSRPLSAEELLVKIKGVEGIMSLLTDRIDGDVMDAAGPDLRIISNYAVGFDNIDIKAASDRGIVVTNTPCEEVNEAVAEHTFALLLSLARHIAESDRAVRGGAYKGWEPDIFLGPSISGKTLGVIGLGRIGTMVAVLGKGFGMNIIYNKSKPDPEIEKHLGAKFMKLDELLKNSDFISLHVPLTEETRHMINEKTLPKMKKGAFLINTARGPVVDEFALVDALKSGQLAGAALDVFDNEPNINPELIGMENVIFTPHIASATVPAREKMAQLAVAAILDLVKNKKPENLVNPEVW
ncbi:MAG TPA: D-glycerate dehydrogenase, partial [Candidatus Saccharimonadales bacterium]|nr:D-glycerate dehydrogenase [Candidatus Saccharimonadales bacterium]